MASSPAPPSASSRAGQLTFFVVVLVPLLAATAGWFVSPPILNPDSASGFAIWESARHGAPWNSVLIPESADISRDRAVFVTWWSPGQYVVPGWWRYAGFSWGQAMLLTTLFGLWIQAGGCWWLARSVGLTSTAAAWLTLAATLQWHSLQQFGHFRGGEVLIEAAAPWLLGIAWTLRRHPVTTLAVFPLLVAGSLWLKLSALLLLVPVLGGLALIHGWPFRDRPQARLVWSLAFVALAAVTWWGLHTIFFGRGPTPATGPANVEQRSALAAFSIFSPWLAATGLGSLVGRISWWLGVDGETFWRTNAWPTFAAGAAAWWAGWYRWIRPLEAPLRRAVMWVLVANVILLAVLYVRGSSISLEDRHLRPVATLLLLAGAVAATQASTPRARRLSQAALVLIAAFGVGAAVQRGFAMARMDSRGTAGYCQQQFSAAAIAHLNRLDRSVPDRQALIYFPSTEIAFEISRQRRLGTDDISRDLATVRAHRWHGRVPRLIVVVRNDMQLDGRVAAVRAAFADYPAGVWRSEAVGGWWFWIADQPAA